MSAAHISIVYLKPHIELIIPLNLQSRNLWFINLLSEYSNLHLRAAITNLMTNYNRSA